MDCILSRLGLVTGFREKVTEAFQIERASQITKRTGDE